MRRDNAMKKASFRLSLRSLSTFFVPKPTVTFVNP